MSMNYNKLLKILLAKKQTVASPAIIFPSRHLAANETSHTANIVLQKCAKLIYCYNKKEYFLMAF